MGNSIKQRLQAVEAQPAQPGQDMRIRKNRVCIAQCTSGSGSDPINVLDRLRPVEVRRGPTELPTSRTRLPSQIQTKSGKTVQNRYVFFTLFSQESSPERPLCEDLVSRAERPRSRSRADHAQGQGETAESNGMHIFVVFLMLLLNFMGIEKNDEADV